MPETADRNRIIGKLPELLWLRHSVLQTLGYQVSTFTDPKDAISRIEDGKCGVLLLCYSRVSLMTEQNTGRSRGFAFVEMANTEEGEKAIAALNGTQLGSRKLNVNEARPKPERENGGKDRGQGGARRGGRQRW